MPFFVPSHELFLSKRHKIIPESRDLMTLKNKTVCILAAVLAFATAANADIINYEDMLGTGTGISCVNYTAIVEDATVDTGGAGLYGGPLLVGNTLTMNPSGFRTNTVLGAGIDFVDSHFETMISVHESSLPNGIFQIDLDEIGDYTINGNAEVSSSINWFIDIPGASGIASGTTVFNASTAAGDDNTGDWLLGVSLDLVNGTYDDGSGPQPLVDANGESIMLPEGDIPKVTFEFDNSLTARSLDATSSAFISKKASNGVMIETHTNCVPEPGSVALLVFGLLGFVGLRRQR